MKQKYYLTLSIEKWRLMLVALNAFRNRLISEGRYTDAVDEVLIKVIYANLLTSGKLPEYLADIDRQAEELFLRLAKQMADAEGITEKLKASDQMEWVRQMNSIRNRAMEIVNAELIFA